MRELRELAERLESIEKVVWWSRRSAAAVGEKLDLERSRFRRLHRRTASLLVSLRPVVAILDP